MNTQLIEKRITPSNPVLQVHSIFLTVQGEGPFSGRKALFIRLAGCNLQCPGCDTDYTSTRTEMTYNEIITEAKRYRIDFIGQVPLIVITGGEPFRQPVSTVANTLVMIGYDVQIETNGSLKPAEALHHSVHIVCSPKTPVINPIFHNYTNFYLKYVIKEGDVDEVDGLPIHALDNPFAGDKKVYRSKGRPVKQIYIQPFDENNKERNYKNEQECLKSMSKGPYIIQLQIHKTLEIE